MNIPRQIVERPQAVPGELLICTSSEEIFRLKPDGEVLYKGRPIANDKELVDGLREVFEGSTSAWKYTKLASAVKDLMLDWSELDGAEDEADVVVNAVLMKEVRRILEL